MILAATAGFGGAFAQETISPVYHEVSNTQELLAAARTITPGSTSGGTIVLKPGMYILDEPIVFKTNHYVHLKGSGWNTLIEVRNDVNGIKFEGCWYSSVEDLWIRQEEGKETGSGIVFRDSSVCLVNRCRIRGFAKSGIRFEGSPERPMSSNEVRHCWIINNRGDQIFSYYSNDFYFLANQIGTGNSRSGCVLEHSSAGTYSMNYHWDNDVALRLGPGSNFNRIVNNRFEESRQSGIVIGSPDPADANVLNIITSNTIHTNSKKNSGIFSAVQAYDAHDVIFSQNQVFSWNSNATRHKHALELGRGCLRWIVKENTLRHHSAEAIISATDQQNIIGDNIILKD